MFIKRVISRLSQKSVTAIIVNSFALRLLILLYCLLHDRYVSHIKFTDVDYHVFTNGSKSIVAGHSPYLDTEYRYSPIIAFIFIPNVLVYSSFGKILISLADVFAAYYLYKLNIYQGTKRIRNKLFLLFWLLNPLNIVISTRGSFEPILSIVILASISYLADQKFLISGLLYGLSVHLKIYPVIYGLPFYIYMIQKKPYIRAKSKLTYWVETLLPNVEHFTFFGSAFVSFMMTSLTSYHYYGYEYLDQSFLYHIKRQDMKHNFSMYFYLFKLLPDYKKGLSLLNFLIQFISITALPIRHWTFESNKRTKLRSLTFSLFISTFTFVSLNKVCTSQYFIWYITFLPLILDSVKISTTRAVSLVKYWIATQAHWLLFAYLYEYQDFPTLDLVGLSSILFFLTNMWIIIELSKNFDPIYKWSETDD